MVILVGVMVLSAGLLLMADRVLADKGDRDDKGDKGGGSATNLSGVTQNWDKNIPGASRFTVLAAFGGEAVRDNETGLVWERSPGGAGPGDWAHATNYCLNTNVGGRGGWRLPSVVELKSVQDPSMPPPFVLVSVFPGVTQSGYWSATTNASVPNAAWIVFFMNQTVSIMGKVGNGAATWCVRGGMNADTY
jgi:hypothetical protein